MKEPHGGNLTKAAESSGFSPDELIDFSANINFLGPPESIISAIKEKAWGIKNYPEANAASIKKKIADHHNLDQQMVVVGSGAAEMIYQLTKVLLPQKILLPEPTFSEYRLAAESIGAEVKEINLDQKNDFAYSISELKSSLAGDLDLLFICNPNNPTSSMLKREEVEEILAAAAEKDILLVVDEAFIDFIPAAQDYSALTLLDDYPNLVILRSLTKLFAVPGLRLGYALASEELASKMDAKRDPWSVNYFAQLAADIIFSERDEIENYLELTRVNISAERKYLYENLKNIDSLNVYSPAANFILVDISQTGLSSRQLQEKLLKKGILIRNCDSFKGLEHKYIRLAVKSRQDNNLLLDLLQREL
jgi:threonine-phosphate decarboxylase